MDRTKRFCKERDSALLSLDEKKIREFAKKWKVPMPTNETVFWAGVHKAICNLTTSTDEQKCNSIIWLLEHGFTPEIG